MLHSSMFIAGIEKELNLVKRHIVIMRLLADKPIGILRLSYLTRLPIHQVRYSLRILQINGLIEPTTKGAILNERGKKQLESFHRTKELLIKELKEL